MRASSRGSLPSTTPTQGNGTRIHHFTLSYETADDVTVHNPEIYGKGLQSTPVMGNEVALDLRLTRPTIRSAAAFGFRATLIITREIFL